ncbi:zona pellucida-like domain-containing protein 1 [Epinephelus lanceolatus]|uniref:zona pellucida-like domain-containing protein 1 n=1 Tax=Epinephelus lanceolatus TaxID=310571 RepID=UPI0014480285|nr:zona pellucida-like domain-containing protein 1 [Epinephelus lanceolatus]XP_033496480.1 zona pellucida-like domain-containing protein 1 [Epinephelus lanceolatus]XP_033496488.1 zona pellucida-like domain-containing protein 1 [Epinephelus lanceolatus]
MWLALLTYQLATLLHTQAQHACIGHSTFRSPANSDIEVLCGSQTVDLNILLCPIYFNGYNESLLSLNSEHSKHQCKGTPDWTTDPPVVKFNFSITEEGITACSSTLTVTEEVGTGVFSDFSTVQYISITGMICSEDPGTGAITYHQEVMYRFSCRYPLQYLVNNTQMSVSGVSLAVKDNNGSFISTLSMGLYADNGYSSILNIPAGGLELKTRIFVQVKASNLTSRFNVLLDRCYATTSPFPVNTTSHDLFVGCNRDGQTVMDINGEQQEARFSFEAFRFIQSTGDTLSTYYVHCATRLCVNTFCPNLIQNCTSSTNSRRRRSANNNQGTTVSDMATVSSGPIITRSDNGYQMASGGARQTHLNSTVLAVSVIAGIVGAICLTLVAFIVYQKHISTIGSPKMILHQQE